MSERVMSGLAALVAAAALGAVLAAPASAMETAAATDAAGNATGFQLRLSELERRIDVIGEQLGNARAASVGTIESKPFVVTYFEELDRYGD